jgi:uncharacterized membrane-anchored protein
MYSVRLAPALSIFSVVAGLFVWAAAQPVRADATKDQEDADAPGLPWRHGPSAIALGHGVKLDLPDGYLFLGQPHAGQEMVKIGNLYNDNLLGLVVSGEDTEQDDEGYLISLRFDEEGHVKDDEKVDPKEILDAIRDGEDEYNKERKQKGFAPIHADGWQVEPRYDKSKHELIWGLLLSSPDEKPEDRSLNYNTRVLGRTGYVSVNLVTSPNALAKHKSAAGAIVGATQFVQGMRYEDFDEKKDKVAEYGLTGLVLGGVGLGVAKLVKIGLLAKFGKVIIAALIAGKKVIIALLVAGAAAARKLFGRRRNDDRSQA